MWYKDKLVSIQNLCLQGGWLAFENRLHWNVAEHSFCSIQLCYQQTYTLKTGMLVENGDSILTLWWEVSFSQINFCLCIIYSGVSNIEADLLSQAPRKISGRPHKKNPRRCHKNCQGTQLGHTYKLYPGGQLTGFIDVNRRWRTRSGSTEAETDNMQFFVWPDSLCHTN